MHAQSVVHLNFTVLAPVLTGSKLFYQLFYHKFPPPVVDLIASGLSEEVLP